MKIEALNLREAIAAQTAGYSSAMLAPPAGAEYGASGTPIFNGFLRELGEYNTTLTGQGAIRTYEQMRRGDGMVAAALMAVKLPIIGTEWQVRPPANATADEKAAAEFVEENLLEGIDLDKVIRNALLMLDFGAAAHENVWAVDGARIRLAKAAARHPITFFRWITAPNGEDLLALEQLGYRGGQYVRVQIPADKLALFVFEQEGANFMGKPLTRAMYTHWFMKNKLYAIDAIACERNGMGIPAIKYGPNAKKEDIETVQQWGAKIAAHESAYIAYPDGYEFSLVGVKGTVHDALPTIQHHNAMIAACAFAQFILLGQEGRGGSRALGKSQSDFFFMGEQSTASLVADVLTRNVARPLVEMNWGKALRPPRVVAARLVSLDFEVLVNAVAQLASGNVGAIKPDDDLEADLRERAGLPAKGTKR